MKLDEVNQEVVGKHQNIYYELLENICPKSQKIQGKNYKAMKDKERNGKSKKKWGALGSIYA